MVDQRLELLVNGRRIRKMSKIDVKELEGLLGVNYTITLDGKDIEVEPLSVKDMAEISLMQEKGNTSEALTLMIKKTLDTGIEGVTDEFYNRLKASVVSEIIPQILKGNGLEGDAKKKLNENLV